MMNKDLNAMKAELKNFLSNFSLYDLRTYGRTLDMKSPTVAKKGDLIELIVGILVGTLTPEGRSKRGAPVLNKDANPKIHLGVEAIRMHYLGDDEEDSKKGVFNFAKEYGEMLRNNIFNLSLSDPNAAEIEANGGRMPIYRGQLATMANIPLLIKLDGTDSKEKVIVPIDLIRECDLREGDVVSCYAKKQSGHLIATQIVTLNERIFDPRKNARERFEELSVCIPHQKLSSFANGKENTTTAKYLDWLAPIYLGQRGVIVSAPKIGKTTVLSQLIKAVKNVDDSIMTLGVLVGQPPENVGAFHKLFRMDDFVYTTYEDEPERQVFIADFILNRAKRMAESGENVLLIIDSFTTLARAFNDTDESAGGKTLTGGLERKTLQYLTRYLGSARAFEKGGSLTIIGLVSKDTGNPADQLISAELCELANYQLGLSETLALSRIYPALDMREIRTNSNASEGDEIQTLASKFLSVHGAENLLIEVQESETKEEFLAKIKSI
jgi:transcription termination factor Rho